MLAILLQMLCQDSKVITTQAEPFARAHFRYLQRLQDPKTAHKEEEYDRHHHHHPKHPYTIKHHHHKCIQCLSRSPSVLLLVSLFQSTFLSKFLSKCSCMSRGLILCQYDTGYKVGQWPKLAHCCKGRKDDCRRVEQRYP